MTHSAVPAHKVAAVRREEGASAGRVAANLGVPFQATIASDGGAFGYALGTLGFGEYFHGESWSGGEWLATESADGVVRVITYPADGDRVVVIGWDPARPAAKLEAWRIEFSGATPQTVALAAIANAVGKLDLTR